VHWLAQLTIAEAIKAWFRRRAARKETKEIRQVFKGKLTYSSLIVIAVVAIAQHFGVEIAESEAGQITEALAVLVGVYGRWRA